MIKAGFVSFVGRPNVGKSTLTNALVGTKIAITSAKPQTTRRAIRGIVNHELGQLILVDLPGVHRPRTLLGERLNDVVAATLGDVDVIAFCSPANERIGPGDKRIVESLLSFPRAKKIAVVTKSELVSRERLAEHLLEVTALTDWQFIMPVSALGNKQLDELVIELLKLLPESAHPLYEPETITEETSEDLICELVREAALGLVKDELPHSIAVTLDEIVREQDSKPKIHVSVWVERDSQKGILIGAKGSRLKEIGSLARAEIEELLGERVHLAIQIRVAPEWQRNPKQLGRLGF